MGTELSKTASPSNEAMSVRMRNNFRPLRFHHIHGDNVKLRNNGAEAYRAEGFCKALAFSDRPVAVGEFIYIRFLDVSSNWSGGLRIGFTMNDPELLKYKLPKYACPNLTSMPGNWVKAIAERMAKKDSILYYYVDEVGDVHYGINSEEYGVFFGGVNTVNKLWAVIDIYGNTLAVEFVDPNALNLENIGNSQSNNSLLNPPEQSNCALRPSPSEYQSILFHNLHGKNVFIRDRNVATRRHGFESLAYVFSERPFILDEYLCFQVLNTDTKSNKNLVYGITSCDPSTLDSDGLPEVEDDLFDRPEYWVVVNDSDVYNVGDYIDFHISPEGKLTVRKNYEEIKELHIDPNQPLWLFLNITGLISKITLLGSLQYGIDYDLLTRFENVRVSDQSNGMGDTGAAGTSGTQALSECTVCYEEPVNCALYRCGHMCMCYGCAMKIWKPLSNVQCPICREVIQDVIKVYI